MDTMQLGLILKEDVDLTRKEQRKIEKKIDNIRSSKGNRFCDFIKFKSDSNKVIIKVSFPRYYYGNNAYLVKSSKECLKVQKTLVEELIDIFQDDLESVEIMRIDIPFTYLMKEESDFTDYNNLYKVMALVYGQNYSKSASKSIINTITEERETILYTDTEVTSAYNHKVMIYDQHLNLKTKLGEEFKKAKRDFPDLRRRMRIEVSKRIKRKVFPIKELKKYDIFKEYSKKYEKYLIENLLNTGIIDKVYKEEAIKLEQKLSKYRKKKGRKFNYEGFILKELKNIYDYKILKEALKLNIIKKKSLESAVTKVRKILKGYEEEEGTKVIDVKKELKCIAKSIKGSFKEKRSEGEDYPF